MVKLYDDLSQSLYEIHTYGVNIETREIYLHSVGLDHEGEESGVESQMAVRFVKNLHTLNSISSRPIIIHSHSVGGNWTDGMAIFDAIKASPSYTTCICYASAESMSSIIPQAADTRVLMPHTGMIIHEGTGGTISTVQSVLSNAKWQKLTTTQMLNVYAERCLKGKYFIKEHTTPTLNEIVSFFEEQLHKHQDWYIEPDEAVYYGLADGIFGEEGFKREDLK